MMHRISNTRGMDRTIKDKTSYTLFQRYTIVEERGLVIQWKRRSLRPGEVILPHAWWTEALRLISDSRISNVRGRYTVINIFSIYFVEISIFKWPFVCCECVSIAATVLSKKLSMPLYLSCPKIVASMQGFMWY